MSSLEKVIEEFRQVVEDEIVSAEAAKRKFDLLIELQKMKNKRLRGERLTDEEIHRAMNLLCWNSYAGCCAPAKDCPWNAAVSDALGVDYKGLYEAKVKIIEGELKKMLG